MKKYKALKYRYAQGRGYWEEIISIQSPFEAENEEKALEFAKWIFGEFIAIEEIKK